MAASGRLLDTGLRRAAENIAFNRALLEARQAEESPSTLRFLRFQPSALLGFHQSAEQELNLEYCRAHDITVQRRITGGGAIYFDETQLGWELYLHRRDLNCADMQEVSRRICEAAARGIQALGVNAQYRPRNDIEVHGRKISGTGGAFDGDALLFQGTLLLQFDVEKMLRVLRIPAEKLSDKAIATARERVANLADLLGKAPALEAVQQHLATAFAEAFQMQFTPGNLSAAEERRFAMALAEIDSEDWVHSIRRPVSEKPLLEASMKFPAGLIQACVAFDAVQNKIRQVCFSGDFFVSPRRVIMDFEASLRDCDVQDLQRRVEGFFAQHQVDMLGLQAMNFYQVLEAALQQQRVSL